MLYIGTDHAGWRMKEVLKLSLDRWDIPYRDMGNHEFRRRDDYPDYAWPVARAVAKHPKHRGLLLCGNGQGMCITANKHAGIRAGLGHSVRAARTARQEDDINVICLPARSITMAKARRIIRAFLMTDFSKKKRYVRRIDKIKKLERASR